MLRSTTPRRKSSLVLTATLVSAFVLSTVATPFAPSEQAYADRFDEQIKAIEQEIDQYNKRAAELEKEGNTLKAELARLTTERDQIQAQLNLSVAKQEKLTADIQENQEKIETNRSLLGQTIADMYVDSEVSPLEMLASSKNISEYIDKQANQNQVQVSLQKTIDEINALKKELEEQKEDVERIIKDQENQRNLLVEKENEKSRLISDTQGKESAYRSLTKKSQAEIKDLEEQQRAEIARRLAANNSGGSAVAGDPNRGGYPNYLASAPQDALVDPWGMYNRQCVSYTAWKVEQKTGNMPYWGGVGNANQWPGNARAAGIPTGTTPKKGAVGVISAGYYGHVVWVESVNGDGTINISQYNEGWSGEYSERYNVNPGVYDTYIYF